MKVVWASVVTACVLLLFGCDEETTEAQAPAKVLSVPRDETQALPRLGVIQDFRLTDQAGRPFTAASLDGSVWVASFFFTRCPTVCPRVIRTLREVQGKASTRVPGLRFVSFSVDPDNDTPRVLREYAKEYEADLSTWTFATGDYDVIKKTTVEGFKMALEGEPNPKADHYGILHGSHFVLVDGKRAIRGYYRSSDDEAIERLLADALRISS